MATCKLNNKLYSEGSKVCIDDNEHTCQSDGQFHFHANQCGGDCDESEDSIKSPTEEYASCYYDDSKYGHGSTICQNGVKMVCDDGKWYGA